MLLGDLAQEAVVVALPADDVAAQEEDGLIEQAGEAQEQDEEDAPGAAIAIVKRVDGLELVMEHGHFDKWVEVVVGVIAEGFEIGDFFTDDILALGGCR